jgi:fused signal recognition particle receptor
MFKFLKDKLKKTVSKITERFDKVAEEDIIENEIDSPVEQPQKSEEIQDEKVLKESEKPQEEVKEPEPLVKEKKEEPLRPIEQEPKEVNKKKYKYKPEEKDLGIISRPDVVNEMTEDEVQPEEIAREEIEVESKDISRTFAEHHDEPASKDDVSELDEFKKTKEAIEKEENRGFFSKMKNKILGKKSIIDEALEEKPKEEVKEENKDLTSEPPIPEQKTEQQPNLQEEASGFIGKIKQKITTKRLSKKQFDELFWDLEVALLENNVAVEVIEKIKADLQLTIVDKPIARSKISDTITSSLRESISSLFNVPKMELLEKLQDKKPYIICFLGINGSGKTTTIAKVAQFLKNHNKTCVLAAADTFRAAAIDQLQLHANNLNVKLIKHDYGSDPAAVAFDAVEYAKAHNLDAVLIDTAGRMHSNSNLMEELKKIIRVAKPDLKIFVGEAIVGNDAVDQCKQFNDAVEVDGIILSKADVDEKGGAAISISYVTKKPILYLGVGQNYSDLEPFNASKVVESVGLEG